MENTEKSLTYAFGDFCNHDAIIQSILGLDLSLFEYVGFDTKTIKGNIKKYIDAGDEAERFADISKLIYLGMKRGNTTKKVLKTCNFETAKWLEKMIIELDIKDTIKDDSGKESNRTLTLSRLKKAFPHLAFSIIKDANFKRRVTTKMIKKSLEGFEILPSITRDMCIMSLLPKKVTEEFTHDLYRLMIDHIFIYCFCESSLLLKPNKNKVRNKVRAEEVIKYMEIMWNAKHVSDDERNSYALQIKEIFESISEEEMKTLKMQCNLIENYAIKLGVNISQSLQLM